MGNRGRTEIVSNILDAANGGVTKTKIMYKAYLSYNQLREYLSVLIENNLIEYLDGTQTYKSYLKKDYTFLKCITKLPNYYKLLQLKMTINFHSNSIKFILK